MSDPVALCLAGQLPPGVALARLALDGLTPDAIAARLPPGSALAALFAAQRDRLDALVAMLRGTDHGATDVETIAAMFDRAVALAPEASVAAYSLGDTGLLAAATAELVDWLCGYAPRDADVLDLGCGIGRVAAALAPRVRSVLGLDVSAGMIAEAERRHLGAGQHDIDLRFAHTDGSPPVHLPTASRDLVLAVDTMPYLMQAGIGDTFVGELCRVLRPAGHLVVLNLSYRGDDAADAAQATDWAARHSLELLVCGARPFALWDGAAYVLRAD